jgi:hypothetical protein
LPEPDGPTTPAICPGRHAEGDVLQHFRPINAIPEAHMLEGDLTADRRQRCTSGPEGGLSCRVEDIAKAGNR